LVLRSHGGTKELLFFSSCHLLICRHNIRNPQHLHIAGFFFIWLRFFLSKSMSFTFSAPSSSSRTNGAAKSGITIGEAQGALPYGREALLRLGGVADEKDDSAGDKGGFDMSLIKIPEGVNPKNLKQFTLYNLLGFAGDLGDAANIDAIKKAYHRAVLMYHPDKAQFKDATGKEDRSVFLKIQEAFRVLCSEPLRRAYDSQLPFDEAIPTEEITDKFMAKGDHKFFKLFGPIFKRNARWSTIKPVPELGDAETSDSDVLSFYSFWNKFESWRDFTGAGADNKPEDAGSREERRYMEKENAKLAITKKKKEMNRIIELVSLSERRDPRIVAMKNAKKEAKEASMRNREAAAANESANETSALAWIDAQETEFKAGQADKAEREKLKKKASGERNLLKKLLRAAAAAGHGSKGEYGIVSADELESICTSADLNDLREMNIALGDKEAEKDNALLKAGGLEVVSKKLISFSEVAANLIDDERISREARKREAEDKAFKSPQKGAKQVREWSDADDEEVKVGMGRYKIGHATRWQSICNYLNDKQKPAASFTLKEVQIRSWQLATGQ